MEIENHLNECQKKIAETLKISPEAFKLSLSKTATEINQKINCNNKEIFAMQCNVCGLVTTLTEANAQFLNHCMKCQNPFDNGKWKSIYRTKAND